MPVLVIFGATGDLTRRKLVPALYSLFRKGRLGDDVRILGVARGASSDDAYCDDLHHSACEVFGTCERDSWRRFVERIHYADADLTRADDVAALDGSIRELGGAGDDGRLYYLAVAPRLFAPIIEHLGAAGMAAEDGGWRRIVVEKPFGHDLDSARELNRCLHEAFDERQVFRIDHYLGKETVQNVLALRFANTLFEPMWRREFVEHVQITVAESVDVGRRGAFYDRVGVLRDMFQNHLLQVLAVTAMEPPARFAADPLRDEKVKVLEAVRVPDASAMVLGRYDGYRAVEGVADDSTTPTYAALRLEIDNWRWRGVPFYLRSGKALATKVSEIVVQFLCPPHLIFETPHDAPIECNRLAIRIQPDEGIRLEFQTKVPGDGMRLRSSQLAFAYRDSYAETPIPEAYERLLLDALEGDAALFTRSDEIERCWAIVDPLVRAAADGEVHDYERGGRGPAAADAFLERDGRRWLVSALDRADAAP